MKKEASCDETRARAFAPSGEESMLRIQEITHILLGVFGAARGLSGEIFVRTYTESPEDLMRYAVCDAQGQRYLFTKILSQGDKHVARVEGVVDRSDAEKLRGRKLYAPRESFEPLEAEQFFYTDLIGLIVKDLSGAPRGDVIAVHNFRAGDILEVLLRDGEKIMIPFSREIVPQIDLSCGFIVVDAQRVDF